MFSSMTVILLLKHEKMNKKSPNPWVPLSNLHPKVHNNWAGLFVSHCSSILIYKCPSPVLEIFSGARRYFQGWHWLLVLDLMLGFALSSWCGKSVYFKILKCMNPTANIRNIHYLKICYYCLNAVLENTVNHFFILPVSKQPSPVKTSIGIKLL